MDGIKEIIDSLVGIANAFHAAPPYELLPLIIESLNDSHYPKKLHFNLSPIYPDVCMVSGGLDSTIAWLVAQTLGKKPVPIYIDFGQVYKDVELQRLDELGIGKNRLIAFDYKIKALWDYYIPLRNLIIMLTGLQVGGFGTNIWMGYVSSEGPGDKSPYWVGMAREYLSQYNSYLFLTNIFTKVEWVKWAVSHGHLDEVLITYSCLNGEVPQCGACKSCFKHAFALTEAGIDRNKVLNLFKTDPFKSDCARSYYELVLQTSKDDFHFPFLHEMAKTIGGDYEHDISK
jgi:7-cyano-7-deazaguanine synthase in queuosine biosynthesis